MPIDPPIPAHESMATAQAGAIIAVIALACGLLFVALVYRPDRRARTQERRRLTGVMSWREERAWRRIIRRSYGVDVNDLEDMEPESAAERGRPE